MKYCSREYTQLASRDLDYQYADEQSEETTLQIERFQIRGQDSISDLVSVT